jgi:plasmid stability protein
VTIITIRNLDDETKHRLQMLAAMHRRSMEAEIREILRYSVRDAPRLLPEPYPLVPLDREVPFTPDQDQARALELDQPLVPGHAVPLALNEEELISVVNRQLDKMGFSEFAIPQNPPLE